MVSPPTPPEAVCATALAGLAGMGPRRLSCVLALWGAEEAWQRVADGRALDHPALAAMAGREPDRLRARWRADAAVVRLDEVAAHTAALGVRVHLAGRAGYPELLADDPEPPAVLFTTGPVEAVAAHPRVAVVGMRNATRYGLEVARRLGRELAEEGVAVVSGLAAGIDGAAHDGALGAGSAGAPLVAVVASGHDVVYPLRHRDLWAAVAAHHVMVSEVPPGGRPEAWRFPARNRVIAAMAQAVVVVESMRRGGSMYTVHEALGRDRPVLAVPGPVDSPASEGTNGLLADGAHPARDTDDVLLAIGRHRRPRASPPGRASASGRDADGPGRVGRHDAAVLDALVGGPRTLPELSRAVSRSLADVALTLDRLRATGRVVQRGQWVERVGRGGR